jgi:hypothetical protein
MESWAKWLSQPECRVKNWRKDFIRVRDYGQGNRRDPDAPSGEHPSMTASAARGAYKGLGENPGSVRVIRQGDVPRDPDEPPLRGSNPNAKTPGGAS